MKNTDGLKLYAENKRKLTLVKVDLAIQSLIKSKKRIILVGRRDVAKVNRMSEVVGIFQ